METVGARIRQVRLRHGLSQAALARAAKVSRPYIVQLENGTVTRPGADKVTRIAEALGIPPSDLFDLYRMKVVGTDSLAPNQPPGVPTTPLPPIDLAEEINRLVQAVSSDPTPKPVRVAFQRAKERLTPEGFAALEALIANQVPMVMELIRTGQLGPTQYNSATEPKDEDV